MSSDGYFSEDIDAGVFEELDAIEQAAYSSLHSSAQSSTSITRNNHVPPNDSAADPKSDDYDMSFFDIDETELERIDNFIEDTLQGAPPILGPARTVQTTLFGGIAQHQPSAGSGPSKATRSAFGHKAPKTKYWDHEDFAKNGHKCKNKGKGKSTVQPDEEEEEDVEFEQFPAPSVPTGPAPPMTLELDANEANSWIFPLNRPKRDYQYNIVKNCLLENTLVALPTGLGKTFIAGAVMLNYYRWFPEGKIVFMSPTKPLISQQVLACHDTCGIPGRDAAELTGAIQKPIRARAWSDKKVFYVTPQTFMNDLETELCDVTKVVLLVVDEAHRASGNYAYNQVVRWMMAKNPNFRLLALTATPGGKPEAVQALIDSLHISHIEIRHAASLDLCTYVHKKVIKQHVIVMSDEIRKMMDLLAKFMDNIIKPLKQRGVLRGAANPTTMHPFAPQRAMQDLKPDQRWAYVSLSRLSTLARAMQYLIEGTPTMCYNYLHQISHYDDSEDGDGKAAAKAKKLLADPLFRAVMVEAEIQKARGFLPHPKMEKLETVIVNHFTTEDDQADTKVMVFVEFRECVDEIVQLLNKQNPLIRATRFIGQGSDKAGRRGLAQKDQLETITKFKEGIHNVLVATCIGEEGLDIGQIDLVVCYDAQKAPIRMLQRVGRTGRKRAGYVHVLLSEHREEQNLDKAMDAYKCVQEAISRGDSLELYADVPRLLPDSVKPQCVEKEMEIEPYIPRLDSRRKTPQGESPVKGTKRKRNDDITRNIPAGASSGFVSVRHLVAKQPAKRKKLTKKKTFEEAGQDGDSDLDIEAGIVVPLMRRAQTNVDQRPGSSKAKLRKTATIDGSTSTTKKKKKKTKEVSPPPVLTSSQFSSRGRDDSDDAEIEQGIPLPSNAPRPLTPEPVKSPKYWSSSPVPVTSNSVIELSDSDDRADPPLRKADDSMAWLLDGDDDDENDPTDLIIIDSSPLPAQPRIPPNESIHSSVEFLTSPVLAKALPLRLPTSPSPAHTRDHGGCMLPPPLPTHLLNNRCSTNSVEIAFPEPSYPVMPPGQTRRKFSSRRMMKVDSPVLELPSGSKRRLQHERVLSPMRPSRDQRVALTRRFLDDAAEHSGEDISAGSDEDEDEGVETESDRQFLQELPETQLSQSYNQAMAYHHSLLTQQPSTARVPKFVRGPARRGPFAGGHEPRVRPLESSSPPPVNEELDHYSLGSFVVDDDDEISYADDSELYL